MWITNIVPLRTPLRCDSLFLFHDERQLGVEERICSLNNKIPVSTEPRNLTFSSFLYVKMTENIFVVTSRTYVLNGTKFVYRLLQIHCFQFKLVFVFRNGCESVKRDNNYKTLFVCFVLVPKEKPYPSDNSLKEQRQWFSPFFL